MSFTAKIKEELAKPLDKKMVLNRKMGGRQVDYIEGHRAIRHANSIFDFDGWSYDLTQLVITDCGTQLKKKHSQGDADVSLFIYSAQAVVKVLVDGIYREDVGYGSGLDRNKAESIEAAGKEAVTDGLKRALRSFGDQFGNGLYDKTFNHTWTPDPTEEMEAEVNAFTDTKKLKVFYDGLPADQIHLYEAIVRSRVVELNKGEKK